MGVLHAQHFKVTLLVKDSVQQEPLTGVTVRYNQTGTRTNLNGRAEIKLTEGQHTLALSYTGYQDYNLNLNGKSGEQQTKTVLLSPKTTELNVTTVSGSRFEKRISEEIVSIEVLRPNLIQSRADNQMDDALQRVPGVDVVENQVNIRGGSGWSYGAGSRVLVMVDDMPMLTGDAADAKWDFLPIENCEQIEILKGAASCLYGSSALNGVINFRTGYAKSKPKTKVMLFNGLYGNPRDKDWIWWDKQQPGFQGGYFSHAQKIGALDVVLGSAWYSEDSYLQGDLNRRLRGNFNLRYRSKKVSGLTVGLNGNLQHNKSQTFFFWQPDSVQGDKFLQPFGGLDITTTTINKNRGMRGNLDPYISYYSRNGSKHTLRTRWFRSKNDIVEKSQSALSDTYYGEYQFQHVISKKGSALDQLNVVAGMVGSYSDVTGLLYGAHTIFNAAPYLQLEKKFKKLWTNVGVRYEINAVDTYRVERRPVFRTGINYELTPYSFLRASFGQGYRYPSIAERFVETSFGASRVFKNPDLRSETGWSTEIGLKTAYKVKNWLGFIDIAAFWMEYQDMMEFNFGLFVPKDSQLTPNNFANFIGFKSINVGRSRINGIDLSVMGEGKITSVIKGRFIAGYTLMNPILLKPDSFILRNISGETNTLKYRYRHSVKFDVEGSYKKWIWGNTVTYNSFMQNIDEAFEATKPTQNGLGGALFQLGTDLPRTIHTFRQKYNKGTLLWDTRLAYQFNPQIKLAFVVKNVLNTIYTERPALIGPLRNFTLQLAIEL